MNQIYAGVQHVYNLYLLISVLTASISKIVTTKRVTKKKELTNLMLAEQNITLIQKY